MIDVEIPEPTLLNAKLAVQEGASLLNRYHPGWWSRVDRRTWTDRLLRRGTRPIDFARLDMIDTENCVLGQLFGSYARGLRKLGLSAIHGTSSYGFDVPMWISRDEQGRRYTALTRAWMDVIAEHRKRAGEYE